MGDAFGLYSRHTHRTRTRTRTQVLILLSESKIIGNLDCKCVRRMMALRARHQHRSPNARIFFSSFFKLTSLKWRWRGRRKMCPINGRHRAIQKRPFGHLMNHWHFQMASVCHSIVSCIHRNLFIQKFRGCHRRLYDRYAINSIIISSHISMRCDGKFLRHHIGCWTIRVANISVKLSLEGWKRRNANSMRLSVMIVAWNCIFFCGRQNAANAYTHTRDFARTHTDAS